MALVKCHECGKEVSTEAKNCPSCGATVKKEKPPRKKWPPVMKWAFIVICFTIVLIITIGESSKKPIDTATAKTPAQIAEDDKQGTLAVLADRCAKVIEKSLQYPEDADIPNIRSAFDRDKFVLEEKNGIYRVQVTFKARIQTNALRKTTAECKWKLNGDNYEPVGGLTIID